MILEQPARWLAASLALGLLVGACAPASPAPTPKPAAPAAATATRPPASATPAGGATVVTAGPQATATRPPASPAGAASKPSTANRAEATFNFVTRLSTPEEIEEIGDILKRQPGILDVIGSERSITVGYDPTQRTPEQIRNMLADARHPVQP